MRQLSLFKGKRQRGEAPPPPLEFHLHATLADICRRWINPGWRFTHLPLGEVRDAIVTKHGRRISPAGARLKRMGVTPGWPDFIFVGPRASVFWLELKRPKTGRLSTVQGAIVEHLMECGFVVLVTDSLDHAVDTLKRAGILRANVQVQ